MSLSRAPSLVSRFAKASDIISHLCPPRAHPAVRARTFRTKGTLKQKYCPSGVELINQTTPNNGIAGSSLLPRPLSSPAFFCVLFNPSPMPEGRSREFSYIEACPFNVEFINNGLTNGRVILVIIQLTNESGFFVSYPFRVEFINRSTGPRYTARPSPRSRVPRRPPVSRSLLSPSFCSSCRPVFFLPVSVNHRRETHLIVLA